MSQTLREQGWAFRHADWECRTILKAARFGQLDAYIRANKGWLRALKELSPRRHAAYKAEFDAKDESDRLRVLDRNQPAQPDCAGRF